MEKKEFKPEEMEAIGNMLGSAYVNVFNNIIDRIPELKEHRLTKISRAQFKEGMKMLGLEDFIID